MALIHYVVNLKDANGKLLPIEKRGLGDVYQLLAHQSIQEINRTLAQLPPDHPAKGHHGLFLKAKENLWGSIAIGLGNRLATFDQTLYMGCNDMTSAEYISKKCGKVTISVTNSQKPLTPLFYPAFSNTRYSQTRSNTQRELIQPDEILRLDRRQCIALFQGRKPALLYKLAPEEFPDHGTLKSCRVADYTPEWRAKEGQQVQTPGKETPVPPEPQTDAPKPKADAAPTSKQGPVDPMGEPNPTKDLEYQLNTADNSLGMVELKTDDVLGKDDEDEEIPPGR